MIVHLFPKSQFTEEFIDYINTHFDRNEHIFVLYTNVPFQVNSRVYDYCNVFDYDYMTVFLLNNLLTKADRIILHNFGIKMRELFLLFMRKSICNKIIWLIWGSDIYCHRVKNKGVRQNLVETMRGCIMRRFPVVASLTDGDYELAKSWYGCRGTNIRLDYCEEHTTELMKNYSSQFFADDGYIHILVGNSATETNQHEEIFRMLAKYDTSRMRIYSPLSYGNKEYGNKIIRLGYKLFGDRFNPITEYMTREEYYKFLSQIDIGIFNNNRQQGMGNIVALLYYGKKVYMRSDTTMWSEWRDKKKYSINDVDKIGNESYEDFISYDTINADNNKRLIEVYLDPEERKKEWEWAFSMPLDR